MNGKECLFLQKSLHLNYSNPPTENTQRFRKKDNPEMHSKAGPHQETVLAQDRLCDNK